MFGRAHRTRDRSSFTLIHAGALLFGFFLSFLLLTAPSQAESQQCDYSIGGTLKVDHQQFMTNTLGVKSSALEDVKIRVAARRKVLGVWATWGNWGTTRTNGNGTFRLSRTKSCGPRRFRIQVRFENKDLQIRHAKATSSTTKVRWYTVYKETSGSSGQSPVRKDLSLTFSSSGNRALGNYEPRHHAEIWYLYQAAIDYMKGYGSRLAFQKRVKVKYPHNHISNQGVSYANPLNKVVYLVKNPNVNHDAGKNPDVMLHELMHIWAYQHSRGEHNVATYFVENQNTHGVVDETYVAFHEGFAEWAAQFVGAKISNGNWSTDNPHSPKYFRDNGASDFGTVEFSDFGWYTTFSLMHMRRPWEFGFSTSKDRLPRANTSSSDLAHYENCRVGNIRFKELLNLLDRQGQKDIHTDDMNWSSYSSAIVSQTNGMGRRGVKAYKKMLDPTSSRQEILGAMCEKGPDHTIVITSRVFSGSTKYTVEASDGLTQVHGSMEGISVTKDAHDQVNGTTATGEVAAGADGFEVSGRIEKIRLDTPDAARVYVDGKEYHTVVVTSRNISGNTSYTLTASGSVSQVHGTLDGRAVTKDGPDQVQGAVAQGNVRAGADGFEVFGKIQSIRLETPRGATVHVDDGGALGRGSPLSAYACRSVGADKTKDFGRTGIDVAFAGTRGAGRVSVRRLDDRPAPTTGISESNVGPDRFVIDARGGLSFGEQTEVQLDVGTLDGVEDASNVTIYKRPTEGTGSFTKLPTRVDQYENELLATTDAFSEFALASETEPLPVELANLEASVTEGVVQLRWKTVSETNNAGFEVQRKTGSEGWATVGSVDSKADGGTSTQPRTYRFEDTDLPFEAESMTYRLKQVDRDGTSHTTKTVTVEQRARSVRLLKTYPNPARAHTTVRYAIPAAQKATLSLYDELGQKVRTLAHTASTGRHEKRIDISSLASGVYFLRLRAAGVTKTRRLTVVR